MPKPMKQQNLEVLFYFIFYFFGPMCIFKIRNYLCLTIQLFIDYYQDLYNHFNVILDGNCYFLTNTNCSFVLFETTLETCSQLPGSISTAQKVSQRVDMYHLSTSVPRCLP